MCCLFGLIDTELRFTGKEKSKIYIFVCERGKTGYYQNRIL